MRKGGAADYFEVLKAVPQDLRFKLANESLVEMAGKLGDPVGLLTQLSSDPEFYGA